MQITVYNMNQSNASIHTEKAKIVRENLCLAFRTLGKHQVVQLLTPKANSRSHYHRGLTKTCNQPKQTSVIDANEIKPGSYSKMTDKLTAEHSNTECLGVACAVCDVYIAHTTM